ncbi:WD40 repeat-like protein [Atractiella rhizophila]|nr:WD40 repeat-like protein [Atractiella rhizophila]
MAPKSLIKKRKRADSISDDFDSDVEVGQDARSDVSSEREDEQETRAQKRVRLAKAYLEDLKERQRGRDEVDAGEIDREIIEDRLRKDALQESENFHNFVAESLILKSIHTTPRNKTHRLPVTYASCSPTLSHIYTSSKEGTIIKWSLSQIPTNDQTGLTGRITYIAKSRSQPKKEGKGVTQRGKVSNHHGEILTLAVSEDGRRVVSGGRDNVIGLWDVEGEKLEWITGNKAHRDAVTAISIRPVNNQVYTASLDRSIKLFSLESLALIDTLLGHQDHVLDLALLRGENAVTVGARDRTARYYKVTEETALVFRGGGEGKKGDNAERYTEGSLECCAMIDRQSFLTGGDSGTISLWHVSRKKPIFSHALAHGVEESVAEDGSVSKNPRWITSIACLKYGDVFATGSWDGHIRLWRLEHNLKSFSPLFSLPVIGVVNSLQILTAPIMGRKKGIEEQEDVVVVAGVGQEHRLGRWMRKREGKNGAVVAVLTQKKEEAMET